MTKIHSRFDLPEGPTCKFEKSSLTQQHFKDECDINNIIRKYAGNMTNITPETVRDLVRQTTPPERLLRARSPMFGHFSQVQDYQSAQNMLIETQKAFLTIPSELRLRFGNDPARFIAWLQDPANIKEAEAYGFIRVYKNETIEPSAGKSVDVHKEEKASE